MNGIHYHIYASDISQIYIYNNIWDCWGRGQRCGLYRRFCSWKFAQNPIPSIECVHGVHQNWHLSRYNVMKLEQLERFFCLISIKFTGFSYTPRNPIGLWLNTTNNNGTLYWVEHGIVALLCSPSPFNKATTKVLYYNTKYGLEL